MRVLLLIALIVLPGIAAAQQQESAGKANLKTPPPIESTPFGRLDLRDGATLNLEGDRKPAETRVGVESFEPGTIGRKPKSSVQQFFGLSIKKPLN